LTKVMLDTNTFDYIYENDIIDKIKSSVLKEKLQLFATHIQIDEIQKPSDDTKKERIKKGIENVHVKIISTFATVVGIGLEKCSKHGFIGFKVGRQIHLPSLQDDTVLFKDLKKVNIKNPLKNTADLIILYTAVIEKMDFLATDNINHFRKGLKVIKENKNKN
jgi:hypothetical protein